MSPLKFFWLLIWAMPVGVFFYVIGHTGSLIVGAISALVVVAIPVMGGVFELMDPRIGVPLFRLGVLTGTYREPPRPARCPMCSGTGRY